MRIAIGSDHGGYKLKLELIKYLKKMRHAVKDLGCDYPESCDYPLFAKDVAKAVSKGKYKRGILVCTSGVGMAMAANKFSKVRAVNLRDSKTAKFSRLHNDANIACFGAGFVKPALARQILKIWLSTRALGGRHKRRVKQIG